MARRSGRQVLQEPCLAAVDRPGDLGPVAAHLDQGRDAQRVTPARKAWWAPGTGHRSSSGRLLRSEPQEPLVFCRSTRNSTPRRMAARIVLGRRRRDRLGLRAGLGPRGQGRAKSRIGPTPAGQAPDTNRKFKQAQTQNRPRSQRHGWHCPLESLNLFGICYSRLGT